MVDSGRLCSGGSLQRRGQGRSRYAQGMRVVGLAFGVLMVVLGIIGIVAPSWWLAIALAFDTPLGLYVAAVLRLGMGAALLLAASHSRMPRTLPALGIVILVAGIITPFFGVERARRVIEWWAGTGFLRAWGVFAVALGVFLIWVVSGIAPHREKRG